jgi:dUTP pyrophosphatase
MKIEVKYHSENSRPLSQAHRGEWIDLKTAKDVKMIAGERMMINLGVSIKVPISHEAIMAPRSSTFKNYGILQTNGIGVIDETYCGEGDVWMFPAYATRDVEIPAGTRIAQFRIQQTQGEISIEEVVQMNSENRGGLGSTGR